MNTFIYRYIHIVHAIWQTPLFNAYFNTVNAFIQSELSAHFPLNPLAVNEQNNGEQNNEKHTPKEWMTKR